MKIPFLCVLVLLTGCQSAPSVPVPPPPVALPRPAALPTPTPSTEAKLRQQAQFIEALLSQNEALSAQVSAAPERGPYPSPVARALMKPLAAGSPYAPAPTKPAETPVLVPNAEGIIDLAAAATPAVTEPVNPFAVRTPSGGTGREVALNVGGIIAGPVACATINDRLVQVGEAVEGFTVEEIEAEAVVLRHGTHRLRLVLSGKPVRVRMAP